MTSKPPKRSAASKRTTFPRAADYTKAFRKDWDRLSQAGRYRGCASFYLRPDTLINPDYWAAAHYGQIRAPLEREGKIIGPYDLMIAAHARSQGLTLVTNNEKEFARVPGLLIENWV